MQVGCPNVPEPDIPRLRKARKACGAGSLGPYFLVSGHPTYSLTDGKVYRADSALVPSRQISESERSGQAQSPQLEAAASRRIVTQEVPSKNGILAGSRRRQRPRGDPYDRRAQVEYVNRSQKLGEARDVRACD